MKKQFVFSKALIQWNSIEELFLLTNCSTKALAFLVDFINCLNAFINKSFLINFYIVNFQSEKVKIVWYWYLNLSFSAVMRKSLILRIRILIFAFLISDWYMILKLYLNNFFVQRVWQRINFLFIMKYFRFFWSIKILTNISILFKSKRQCFRQRIIINSFLS